MGGLGQEKGIELTLGRLLTPIPGPISLTWSASTISLGQIQTVPWGGWRFRGVLGLYVPLAPLLRKRRENAGSSQDDWGDFAPAGPGGRRRIRLVLQLGN